MFAQQGLAAGDLVGRNPQFDIAREGLYKLRLRTVEFEHSFERRDAIKRGKSFGADTQRQGFGAQFFQPLLERLLLGMGGQRQQQGKDKQGYSEHCGMIMNPGRDATGRRMY